MNVPVPALVRRPHGVTTPLTDVYWQAAEQGRLLLQRCTACGHLQHYPRTLCSSCWCDDLTWVDASGRGRVATATVVHMPGHPAWQSETPYVLALVELDEGPRLMTNVVGVAPDSVTVGDRVRLAPAPGDPSLDGPALLQFTPCDTASPRCYVKEMKR